MPACKPWPACKTWDVVKVPFPYTNRPVRNYRPALVVAVIEEGPGLLPGLLWMLMITSAENRSWPGDVPIHDLKEAGLPVPSVVRTAKIATIEAAAVQVLGALGETERAAVRAGMARLP